MMSTAFHYLLIIQATRLKEKEQRHCAEHSWKTHHLSSSMFKVRNDQVKKKKQCSFMITFPDNEIGDLGAEAFAQLIEKNTSIREICLSCTLHLFNQNGEQENTFWELSQATESAMMGFWHWVGLWWSTPHWNVSAWVVCNCQTIIQSVSLHVSTKQTTWLGVLVWMNCVVLWDATQH